MFAQEGARLREEREWLGLKQADLWVAPKTQRFYESGERCPDLEYFKTFAEHGGDVLYVVTGSRAIGVVSDIEARLINAFRASPEAVRDAIMAALQAGAASASATPIAASVEQLTTEKNATTEGRKALEAKAGIRTNSSNVDMSRKVRLKEK
jgi:hypothetical protein